MIKKMTLENMNDINKANDSFNVIGRIIPTYENGIWSYVEELYSNPYEKKYDDEDIIHYDYQKYANDNDYAIYFYYCDSKCVGQIILHSNWNKYSFIEDISVLRDYRGKGIGRALINTAIEWAKQNNLCGLMLETQDINLLACRFYNNLGMKIGAVDNMLYANFPTCEEKAIFWYLKF